MATEAFEPVKNPAGAQEGLRSSECDWGFAAAFQEPHRTSEDSCQGLGGNTALEPILAALASLEACADNAAGGSRSRRTHAVLPGMWGSAAGKAP